MRDTCRKAAGSWPGREEALLAEVAGIDSGSLPPQAVRYQLSEDGPAPSSLANSYVYPLMLIHSKVLNIKIAFGALFSENSVFLSNIFWQPPQKNVKGMSKFRIRVVMKPSLQLYDYAYMGP